MQKRRRPRLAATRPVLVAIPVRDEAEEIGPYMLALAAQRMARIDAITLCLNNCRDRTADVVRALGDNLPFRVHPMEVTLPEGCAGAGHARRIAMEQAADLAGRDAVLLTTDADARVGQAVALAVPAVVRPRLTTNSPKPSTPPRASTPTPPVPSPANP